MKHHHMSLSLSLILGILLTGDSHAQSIHINEIMSSNTASVADEDGEYSDWLELYNSGSTPVDLADWGLSDKKSNPFKWVFPAVSMPPQSWLLIFASSKDRTQLAAHWETVIRKGMLWRYSIGAAAVPASWIQPSFDDSGWNRGAAGIGFGDNDDATVIPQSLSVFSRITFSVSDPARVEAMLLDMDFDDGFVAYLNGIEIARANLGQAGVRPAWNLAAADHEATMYRNLPPLRFSLANHIGLLRSGANLLAVEVHNSSLSSSDLSMNPYLSLGYATLPPNAAGPAPELSLKPSHLHSNFAISAAGETLVLSNAAGVLIDSVTIPSSATDISYARIPDGGARWLFVNEFSPQSANYSGTMLEDAGPVTLSAPSGFYQQPFSITLACPTPGAQIRYTRDGAEPDSASQLYTGGINIGTTTVVRARAFGNGMNPGPISTHNYILTTPPAPLPVLALTTDPRNLWDEAYGIYVLGTSYESADPHYGANFWEDWERPVHLEFFEPGGELALHQDAGMKIFGGWSRDRPQKSLAFFARGSYGQDDFTHRLFPMLPFDKYHSFITRNAANDWDRTFFADGLIHTLTDGMDLEHQAYRPCTVYLNGAYWGILNMREKINEHYLAQHHGVDAQKIDLLEMDGNVLEGVNDHYIEMKDFIATKDLAQRQNYDHVKTQMDVEEYITYQAVQIYVDNRDWPGNNIKFWRPQTANGRWRWILYDTEWGFGINAYGAGGNQNAYTYNTLAFATSPTQSANHHGNPPWSTLLLRRLLLNSEFKNKFINRFADLMNQTFKEQRVNARIDSLQDLLEMDMPKHYDKWRQPVWWSPDRLWWGSMSDWYSYIDIMRQFGKNRPGYMRAHLIQKFALKSTCLLRLECFPEGAGQIIMNDFLPVDATPWSGLYFSGIPLSATAKARPGYRFIGWEGAVSSSDPSIQWTSNQTDTLKACFAVSEDSNPHVVINEINYKSASAYDAEDWIELYNYGAGTADISGWHLKDDDNSHDFIFPANTQISGGGYLVISRDLAKFKTAFPQPGIPVLGTLSFGLSSGGDQVRLYDAGNALVDSVAFGVTSPWPDQANGQGATLELCSPALDNTLASNWAASQGHGTPGLQNACYTGVKVHRDARTPQRIELAQNYPNPFNASTCISYDLPAAAPIRLLIYSVQGRCIRTLANGQQEAGRHQLIWDGRDDAGIPASSGLYFCILQSGAVKSVRQLLLLR